MHTIAVPKTIAVRSGKVLSNHSPGCQSCTSTAYLDGFSLRLINAPSGDDPIKPEATRQEPEPT